MLQPRERISHTGRASVDNLRLVRYQKQRRNFAYRVYILATFFVGISFLQWLPCVCITDLRNFFLEHPIIVLLGSFIVLVTITIFIFFEFTRVWYPFNWILTLIMVESVTISFMRPLSECNRDFYLLSFVGTTFLLVAVSALANIISRDLTLDTIMISLCSTIFFVLALLLFISSILVHFEFPYFFYAVVVILVVIMFTMYHAQTIVGGRFAEMRLQDFLIGALMVYFDFICLFLLIFFIISIMSSEN